MKGLVQDSYFSIENIPDRSALRENSISRPPMVTKIELHTKGNSAMSMNGNVLIIPKY
jgi:hypothetical protein